MIPYPIIDHISNKIFHIIRNFPKFYFANFWSMRCTTMCFQMTLWDQVLNAWISGWRLMTHYKIQHFEIPIEKKLNLKPPRQSKIYVLHILDLAFKRFQNFEHVLMRIKHCKNVNVICWWNNARWNNLKIKFCIRTALIASNQNVYFALWMFMKICCLLARSACCKWVRPDDSYNLIFGSEGKMFNPVFEKIILKRLNPDVESRNKLLVSTACATVIFWTNWKPAASAAFLKTSFF